MSFVLILLPLELEVSNQQDTKKRERTASGRRKSETEGSDTEDENDRSEFEDDMDDEDYKISADEAEGKSKRLNTDCPRSYVTRRNAKILKGEH